MGQRPPGAVLIVEDNDLTRDALEQLLAAHGYETATASDGLDALAYLRGGGHPSVIVLDMLMPNMDGWAFRRAIQAEPRFAAIPVVVFSADSRARDPLEGVAGYVPKASADPTALLDLIDQAAGAFR